MVVSRIAKGHQSINRQYRLSVATAFMQTVHLGISYKDCVELKKN